MNTIRRRSFLQHGVATGFGSVFCHRLCHAFERSASAGPFRRCLVLWMEGGPSQQDTFDPKPTGARGSIATCIDGVRFSETLPRLAERADQLCVLRSIGSGEGEHNRATELMHTGFSPLPSFPRPSVGSMVSHWSADPGFPRYVTLGGRGFGPAFLDNEDGPFVIEDLSAARGQLDKIAQKRSSLDLLAAMNERYRDQQGTRADGLAIVAQRSSQIQSVRQLLGTGFPDALKLESALPSRRERYGNQLFGQRLLAAWRLLNLGVPFVEAQLGGWDTHVDNQRRTEVLCQQLERPWVALLDDLQSSGLWDDTLIVWMGEFGRTPSVNAAGGRDHFPEVTPVVLAGRDLGGKVIGQTSEDGRKRVGETHTVADLFATILSLMGLDIDAGFTTAFGSPTTITDGGSPIHSLGS
ncbi:MAG: DUF1501 domain-containing protein [Rubripirellula sp.]|nr:DUF1501 domain-containing protein [Rubripirellula sp.]